VDKDGGQEGKKRREKEKKGEKKIRRKREKIGRKKEIENRKMEIKKREGYYRHFTLLSTLHSREKLFCQMFFSKWFQLHHRIRSTSTATAGADTDAATAVPNAPAMCQARLLG
jgi:DNA polymerase II small subunit/DNA polymerase delta subunit B